MRLTTIASFFVLSVSLGCGGDDAPIDGGATDTGVGDTGVADAGPDTALPGDTGVATPDTGPAACTTGCAILELAAGHNHTCARRESGQVRCWGSNTQGQVGDGAMRHSGGVCPMRTGADTPDCANPETVSLIADAVQLSSLSGLSSCVRRMSGDVHCWGLTSVPPSVGSMTRVRRFVPEPIVGMEAATDVSDGFDHTCAVVGGEVICVGWNSSGQLGIGGTMEARTAVTTVTAPGVPLTGVIDVETASLGDFTCARTATEVYCWGNNSSSQLGDGGGLHDACMGTRFNYDCSQMPVIVPGLAGVTQISLGESHGCAVTATNTLLCWGDNAWGQLGLGDSALRPAVPTAVPGLTGVTYVAAGGRHTCALLDTGAVHCWGRNRWGQLGDGLINHMQSCTVGSESFDCSPSPVQVKADAAPIADATLLASGWEHSCVLRSGGGVWCWGWNEHRQLGDGTGAERATAVRVLGLDLL